MNFGHGFFGFYWVMLIVSGILMLGLGISRYGGQTSGMRIVTILFGVGFIGYGGYLGLFFTGHTYTIFFQAFILPVALIANGIRGAVDQSNKRKQAQARPMQQAPMIPTAPTTPPPATLSSDDVLGR